jgi:hypothetical protein
MKNKNKLVPAVSKLNLLRQICNFIPDFLVPKLARQTGVEDKVRTFSAWSHVLALLYYQKTRLTLKNCGSRGCSIVVVEHSAEFFSALDVTHLGQGRRGLDQLVLDPLMIAPLAIIVDEGRDGGPQLLLA